MLVCFDEAVVDVSGVEWTLNTSLAEALSVGLLVAVLAFAVARPRMARGRRRGPGRRLVVGVGAVSVEPRAGRGRLLGPVVGFLAAILVLAQLCDDEGLFARLRLIDGADVPRPADAVARSPCSSSRRSSPPCSAWTPRWCC